MRALGADSLRDLYLQFFADKGHHIVPSASLAPTQDPTILLTSAGMVPFKPYFLGLETPPHPRLTSCQRCVRTGDIDNVGKTDRHHTFFEMLGNFSFGDYFKREAIEYAWEFVTEQLHMDPSKLWATIYLDDDESFDLWHRGVGLAADRIVRLGREDNFWEIGIGPCGPCSELHYDRGPEYGCNRPDCAPGCDECERYLEFWNLVFIEFHQDEEGRLTPLASKGVDTGLGLERTVALLNGMESNYDIDVVRPIIDDIAASADVVYGEDAAVDVSLRVIADHVRAVTFMIFDGMLPGNEGRSYVLRRLLRRAISHARLLGITDSFLPPLATKVIQLMRRGYPDLPKAEEMIQRVITEEEARFQSTLEQGSQLLEKLMDSLRESGDDTLSGADAFRLYDTYGFPLELTEEIVAAAGLVVDTDGFQSAMEDQRERARAARDSAGYMGDPIPSYQGLGFGETPFVGYDRLTEDVELLGIAVDGQQVDAANPSDVVDVFLSETPFYPEGGGQVADSGTLSHDAGQVVIENVQKGAGGVIVHRGRVVSGVLQPGLKLTAAVNDADRRATARNHTATHLLHQALRDVLGDHASQAGSSVTPARLRFDVTHGGPILAEQLARIERLVNEKIFADIPVSALRTTYDDALGRGALALFGEKYGSDVRMVAIGDYSKELCGGTHVQTTAEIGLFKITAENGIASGVRRIEAVTGQGAVDFVDRQENVLIAAAELLQAPILEVPDHIDALLNRTKTLEQEIQRLNDRLARIQATALAARAQKVAGIDVIVFPVDNVGAAGLRSLADGLMDEAEQAAIVLGSHQDQKVQLIAMMSDGAEQAGVRADEVVRHIAGTIAGGGGGNGRMAQAGGRDASRLKDALAQARQFIQTCLEREQDATAVKESNRLQTRGESP